MYDNDNHDHVIIYHIFNFYQKNHKNTPVFCNQDWGEVIKIVFFLNTVLFYFN